jgi:hypothetical protein
MECVRKSLGVELFQQVMYSAADLPEQRAMSSRTMRESAGLEFYPTMQTSFT